MEDWDEFDDEDEASEDQIALDAFDAFMDVEGDSDIAQASREALAAITESALALKARRQAREQREALQQAAERERQATLARQEEERVRREAHQRTERRAERRARAHTEDRARLEQEARRLALERGRLRIQQEQFEARRRKEEVRKARRERPLADANREPKAATRPPVTNQKKSAKRLGVDDRRAVATTRRVERPANPAARSSKRVQPVPPIPSPRPANTGGRATLTGADLVGWRSRLGLTQTTAASRLGVGQGTISKAEAKESASLGPTLLRALAAALDQQRRMA